MNHSAAPVGHNRRDYTSDVRREMSETLDPFRQRRDEFIAAAGRAVVRSIDEAGRAADLIGMAAEVGDRVTAARKDVSDPHFEAHRTAIAEATAFWEPVTEAMGDVQGMVDAYTAQRDALIAQQKEEQAAAAQPVAPGPRANVDYTAPVQPRSQPETAAPTAREGVAVPAPARTASIRGDYGYKVTKVAETVIEVVDWRAVPEHIMDSPVVKEAIRKVALGIVRATKVKNIPGLLISEAGKNSIRK